MKSLAIIDYGSIDLKSEKLPIITIGQLENRMKKKFNPKNAIPGDKNGLLIGDKDKIITKVAVALDPTISAIKYAREAGANLLVTHHPVFRDGVNSFHPFHVCGMTPGSAVYEAIWNDIACMNFHTCLDVSKKAQLVLPSLMRLEPLSGKYKHDGIKSYKRILEPIRENSKLGFGTVCKTKENITLNELACRANAVFGRKPRVWGDLNRSISSCVCALGSAGNLTKAAINAGIDCLIAGEVKYHDALFAKESGLCIIELGHDVSELPLAALLANEIKDCGLKRSQIILIDQSHNWTLSDAIRM